MDYLRILTYFDVLTHGRIGGSLAAYRIERRYCRISSYPLSTHACTLYGYDAPTPLHLTNMYFSGPAEERGVFESLPPDVVDVVSLQIGICGISSSVTWLSNASRVDDMHCDVAP